MPGQTTQDPEALVRAVGLTDTQVRRCAEYRTRFAGFWLLMLLPDDRAPTPTRPRTCSTCSPGRADMVQVAEKRVRSGHGG